MVTPTTSLCWSLNRLVETIYIYNEVTDIALLYCSLKLGIALLYCSLKLGIVLLY
jgi:hypothetical protein